MFAPRIDAPAFTLERVTHCNFCNAQRVYRAGICGVCFRNGHTCFVKVGALHNGRCAECGSMRRALDLKVVSP